VLTATFSFWVISSKELLEMSIVRVYLHANRWMFRFFSPSLAACLFAFADPSSGRGRRRFVILTSGAVAQRGVQ
jgi:hypothetical protein